MESERKPVTGSLPLQMAIYFNMYFSPSWFLIHVMTLRIKLPLLTPIYQFLAIASLAIMSVVEAPRLYMGYGGNLQEKIAHLVGFWLLSILLQVPLNLFMIIDVYRLKMVPMERTVDWIMTLFLMIQIPIGFNAIKVAAANISARYDEDDRTEMEKSRSPSKTRLITISEEIDAGQEEDQDGARNYGFEPDVAVDPDEDPERIQMKDMYPRRRLQPLGEE